MPKYNSKANVNLEFNFNIDVPQEVVKSGDVDLYINNFVNDIIKDHGVSGLFIYTDNYKQLNATASISDYTRLKSDSDDLDNDLMEFDIF